MARKFVITSGKGGVGKTTICANLGSRLAHLKQKVCILDVDIGLNNLDVVMGVEKQIIYDIVDCIEGRCRIKQALIQDNNEPYLYIMPSTQSLHSNKINKLQIKSIVDELSSIFDYILIDCPAGIDLGFHRAVFSASEAIVVTTPHISAIKDASKVVDILSTYELFSTKLVINRARGDLMASNEMLSITDISHLFDIELIGVIPEDDNITTCLNSGGAVISKSRAGMAFAQLAENIQYNSNKIINFQSEYKGLWGYLKRKIKRKI